MFIEKAAIEDVIDNKEVVRMVNEQFKKHFASKGGDISQMEDMIKRLIIGK